MTYEQKNQLPTNRAMRMAASADGRRIAFGWLGLAENVPGLPTNADAVSVWQVNPNQVVRNKLLPWRPDIVFTGHGVRPDGPAFLFQLVRQTELSLSLPAPAGAKSN